MFLISLTGMLFADQLCCLQVSSPSNAEVQKAAQAAKPKEAAKQEKPTEPTKTEAPKAEPVKEAAAEPADDGKAEPAKEEEPVKEKEVCSAIRQMGLGKAPGPDGLGAEFYKEFEDLVADDLKGTLYGHAQ